MSQRIEEQRQRRRDRKAAKRKLVSEELVRFGESLEGKMVRWTCRSETYVGKVAAFIPANSDATPVVEQEWGFSWESLRRLGTRKLRPVSCHHRLLIRYPRLFVVGQDLIMLPILTAKTMPRFVV